MKVTVTDTAVEKLNKMLESTGKEYLRFDVGASTCCYFVFTVSPSDKTDRDFVIESSGFKFLVHDEIKDAYKNATVDYITEGFSQGLKVELS
ncbi:MAG: iron-sulfur cluster biosynthesis family protein [Lagierella massiliensis]|nr:iron-sulfur cluster biosynthesis family protein [Lagierella massiliensis]